MKVDNFELIKDNIHFTKSEGLFLTCLIVARKKDGNNGGNKCLQMYFINSKDKLDELRENIIHLCEHYKARAYVNLSPKSFRKMQAMMLSKLAELNLEGNIINPMKLVMGTAEKCKSINAKWIIDIDDLDIEENIRIWLTDRLIPVLLEIPTRHGKHLITKPFNLKEFNDNFPDVDVHKNSMGTLLYYPDSIDQNVLY